MFKKFQIGTKYILILSLILIIAFIVVSLFGLFFNQESSEVDILVEEGTSIPDDFNQQEDVFENVEEDFGLISDDSWCTDSLGIVLPFNESLCWQKEVTGNNRNYANSLSYCQDLELGDLQWDMPTRTEMVKLRNYACEEKTEGAECSPCDPYQEKRCSWVPNLELHHYLNDYNGFVGFQLHGYWTKTLVGSNSAWGVGLRDGLVYFTGLSYRYRVVCVSRKE